MLTSNVQNSATNDSPPEALFAALATIDGHTKQLPRWLELASLPPLSANGQLLDAAQVSALLVALSRSDPAQPHPMLPLLRTYADKPALRAFLWQLFSQWEAKRSPGRWVFDTLSQLGDDEIVDELVSRIHAWRAAGKYRQVELAMECLATMGHNGALRALQAFTLPGGFLSLRNRANEQLNRVAAARQLTRQQLQDRIVPDFGLGSGTLFCFGQRQLSLELNDTLAPTLRDQHGKTVHFLPKPTADESPAMAQTRERWTLLRKTMTQEIRTQSGRFEQAMIDSRRWSVADWRQAIAGHPLLATLAHRVLWAGYGPDGTLQDIFCLNEDMSAATEQYGAMDFHRCSTIGIPHPVEVSPVRRLGWAELLHDFHIMPLFAQANRPVYELNQDEQGSMFIRRFATRRLNVGVSVKLQQQQWLFGESHPEKNEQRFYAYFLTRRFAAAQITAVAHVRRQLAQGRAQNEYCHECFFVPGLHKVFHPGQDLLPLALDAVPPVVLSEVLYNWEELTSNPKYRNED